MTTTKKPTQTDFGRAFEWAVGCSISRQIGAAITASPFAKIAESSYEKMNENIKTSFIKAADIAIADIEIC